MKRGFCAAVVLTALLGKGLLAVPNDNITEVEAIKVISATGYEQNIADAPASMFVITKEELENKSFNDLTDILKNVPGVYVEGGSVFKDISIRGMSSSYTLYLIDGKPMSGNDAHSPNGMSGGIAANSLPPVSMIERIEVVRGPMSSLYGSEAMGGVINIITKKTPQEWGGSFKGEYTRSINDITEDGYQGSINIAGPVIRDILSLQAYGSVLQQDESYCPNAGTAGADCGDKSSAPTPEFKVRKFGTKLILNINNENSIWTNYDYSKQIKKETEGISYAPNASNRVNGLAVKQVASAGHDLKLDDFTLNTYIQNAATKNPSRGDGIYYDVLTLNTQGNYFFETNILSVGAQYKKETLDDRGTNVMHATYNGSAFQYNSYEVTKQQYSVFTEDEWSITDALSLTGGIRVNNYEDYGTHVTPRIYAIYKLTDDFLIKGGVSTGYKAPSLRQSADDFGGVSGGGSYPPVVMIGSPDVKPESSINYEASIAYANKDIGLGVSVTAYHSEYKDKIQSYTVCNSPSSRAPTAGDDGIPFCTQGSKDYYETLNIATYSDGFLDLNRGPYSSGSRYENVKGAEIEGVEVTFDYDILSNLVLGHTYTYTRSEQKAGANIGKALNGISKHMINTNIDYQATNKLSLWGQYNYRSKAPETTSTTSVKNKGYYFVDVGAVYRLKDDLKITAGVYNIFDKEITFDTHGKFIEGRRIALGFNTDF
ncbi:MAG: TonB-dependent receptor [Campylobacteraceae bacterium]|jgi:outer membrane receptor for ferrienterochelin and colicins|nr:TonB-dependent receptor [Campylobacteraceae bacterium]